MGDKALLYTFLTKLTTLQSWPWR